MSKKYRKCLTRRKKKHVVYEVITPEKLSRREMEFIIPMLFAPMEPDETWVSDEKGPYRVFERMMEYE